MNFEKRKNLRELEEQLVKKFDPLVEDGIIEFQHETNWQQGQFMSVDVFNRMYENFALTFERQDAIIKVGNETDVQQFRNCFHNTAAKTIIATRRKQRLALLLGLVFFIVGVGVMVLSAFDVLTKIKVVDDTIIILSWVFLWAAFEKAFFEAPAYRYKVHKLVMLCNSKIER